MTRSGGVDRPVGEPLRVRGYQTSVAAFRDCQPTSGDSDPAAELGLAFCGLGSGAD